MLNDNGIQIRTASVVHKNLISPVLYIPVIVGICSIERVGGTSLPRQHELPLSAYSHPYVFDRSGSEEEYDELQQLLEDILTYRRDMAETKEREKAVKKKQKDDEKKTTEEMRRVAVKRLASIDRSLLL